MFRQATALIADNYSTKKNNATKSRKQLIGYSSHRSQIAIRGIISDDENTFQLADSFTIKLWAPLLHAILHEETFLSAKWYNDTRQTSVSDMLKRHLVLRNFVCQLNDVELDDALLPAFSEHRTDAILIKLEVLNGVVLKRQLHRRTVCQALAYFDTELDVILWLERRVWTRRYKLYVVLLLYQQPWRFTMRWSSTVPRLSILQGVVSCQNNGLRQRQTRHRTGLSTRPRND